MTPRTWALAAGTAAGAMAMSVRSLGYSRVYVSVRSEAEFEPLLIMGGTLVANFCILTDQQSKSVSEQVKELSKKYKLRCVDVELDEPGVAHLGQRYAVGSIPTLIAFHGGNEIDRWTRGRGDVDGAELDAWMKSLCSDDVGAQQGKD